MNTIEKDTGNELARVAQIIAKRDGIDIAAAQRKAFQENPLLTTSYNLGRRVGTKSYEALSEPQKQMLVAQNAPELVQWRANELLDQYAKKSSGIVASEPVSHEKQKSYRAALLSLKAENPGLAEASETGYIRGSDWELLGLLMPALSSEIERLFGAKPLINYTKDGKRIAEDIRQCMSSSTNALDQISCYF